MTGWSYLFGKNKEVNIKVIINGQEKQINSIECLKRPDVQKAFNSAGIDSGFKIRIAKPNMKGKISVIFELFENDRKIKEKINCDKVL
ncbi:hypothetical protein KCK72_004575 [Escherichia coli]|nr:hypothetical protein [Escherichia coli]